MYRGIIIKESLKDRSVLDDVVVTNTKVEQVTESHQTPWLRQWTLHTVEVPDEQAATVAERISQSLDRPDEQKDAWYADFKSNTKHYIIFPGKVFHIDRTSEAYEDIRAYGKTLGIPDAQLDFSPEIQ